MFLHTFGCNKFITLRQMSSIASMMKRKCTKYHLELYQRNPYQIKRIEKIRKMMNLHSKFKSMLALLSPNGLKALQRYIPPSASEGFLIVRVSKNRCFLALRHS